MSDRDFRLDGQTVAVLGASRGIGAAAALACARAGADLVLLGRRRDDLRTVADQIAHAGGRAAIRACDVTSTGSIDEAFEAIDRLDVLVNSAGTNQPESFL